MSNTQNIDILLSTYNGGNYLEQLLDSLINQTYSSWRLIVRDDGSTDNTRQIIERPSNQYPIIFIEDKEKHLGACNSFARLLNYSTADYIMFCDQDDVWLPQKIEKTLRVMADYEFNSEDKAILIHSDLKVVNSDLSIISSSFWKYQKIYPNKCSLNNLLIQNVVTGCTMMINKKLKNLVLPIPPEAIMHDWWIVLVASTFGEVGYFEESTILYRQHNNNDTGAKKYSFSHFLNRFINIKKQVNVVFRIVNQGKAFLLRFESKLLSQDYEILMNFTTLFNQSRWNRVVKYYRYNFKKHGKIRSFGFFLLLIFFKKK